jgi:hypothetical protein
MWRKTDQTAYSVHFQQLRASPQTRYIPISRNISRLPPLTINQVNNHLTTDIFYNQVLATIVSMRAPFRAVENPEWQKLALLQNPRFALPSSTTICTRLIVQVKNLEENALKCLVKGSKVALSLDGWSSSTRLLFLGIVAHYITKDWELVDELIGFESLTDVYSGAKLAQVVNMVTEKFNISNQIISITTDNASSNSIMMTEINNWVQDATAGRYFQNGQIQYIPCLAYIIQLVLKALLGAIRLRPTNDIFIRDWEEKS